jgi:hypothetical protein
MTVPDPKETLHRYLRLAREALLWKLEGLSEYDVRRPMVPTATNLLGIVKYLAGVEFGYIVATFGPPVEGPPAWMSAWTDVDMWAAADETRDEIVRLYQRAAAHADATIEALPMDAPGRVPWWPEERATVSLHQILVHMVAETNRHGGHADIVRELIDGAVGMRRDNDNLAFDDEAGRDALFERVEAAARQAGGVVD